MLHPAAWALDAVIPVWTGKFHPLSLRVPREREKEDRMHAKEFRLQPSCQWLVVGNVCNGLHYLGNGHSRSLSSWLLANPGISLPAGTGACGVCARLLWSGRRLAGFWAPLSRHAVVFPRPISCRRPDSSQQSMRGCVTVQIPEPRKDGPRGGQGSNSIIIINHPLSLTAVVCSAERDQSRAQINGSTASLSTGRSNLDGSESLLLFLLLVLATLGEAIETEGHAD